MKAGSKAPGNDALLRAASASARRASGESSVNAVFEKVKAAFVSAFVLNFLRALRSFETPVLQGTPGNIKVFVSRIYDSMALEFNPECPL